MPSYSLIGAAILMATATQASPMRPDDPAADASAIYVEGTGEARTQSAAEAASRMDALKKLAAIVGTSVSVETTDVETSERGAENSSISVKARSSTKARIQDDKLVERVATSSRWPWPFRRYTVKSLYRWPKSLLKREQERQMAIERGERLEAASGKAEIDRVKRWNERTLRLVLDAKSQDTPPWMIRYLRDIKMLREAQRVRKENEKLSADPIIANRNFTTDVALGEVGMELQQFREAHTAPSCAAFDCGRYDEPLDRATKLEDRLIDLGGRLTDAEWRYPQGSWELSADGQLLTYMTPDSSVQIDAENLLAADLERYLPPDDNGVRNPEVRKREREERHQARPPNRGAASPRLEASASAGDAASMSVDDLNRYLHR